MESSGRMEDAPSTRSSVRKKPGSTTVVEMPKGSDVEAQGLHPALEGELGGGVGGAELLPDDGGGRGDGDDLAAPLGAHTGRTARVTLSGPKKLVSIWARNRVSVDRRRVVVRGSGGRTLEPAY